MHLEQGKTVDSLKLKDGHEFQTDCIIYAFDGIGCEMEAEDDEHLSGHTFTIDDIIELRVH
ncbi:MAG: hypothetical protein ACD_67C00230G0005 [uncultured bacterium]|nr:MAG: hypothetical protein ACD_67C00230G0005 [uncultured bacterium]